MATAATGRAQVPGDFSLLSLWYYIFFYDWSYVYWNYLPFKKMKLKKKFEDSVHWSQLIDFKRLVSCCADRNTAVSSRSSHSSTITSAVLRKLDSYFSGSQVLSGLHLFLLAISPLLLPSSGQLWDTFHLWEPSVTFKMKNQKLNKSFSYETGQMREASKLPYTKEDKTSFYFRWFVIPFSLWSCQLYKKLIKDYSLFSLVKWCIYFLLMNLSNIRILLFKCHDIRYFKILRLFYLDVNHCHARKRWKLA